MDAWQLFWTVFFFLSVGVFAVLAIVVAIGGFFDIRWMFKRLRGEPGADEAGEPSPERSVGGHPED
jgi:nitrate reductase NapE component